MVIASVVFCQTVFYLGSDFVCLLHVLLSLLPCSPANPEGSEALGILSADMVDVDTSAYFVHR